MENQHRRIFGYRELGQVEIDMMNEIKALGPVIEAVVIKVGKHLDAQLATLQATCRDPKITAETLEQVEEEIERIEAATPERFRAGSKTDFQTALMLLTRAVAQPTFF